MEILFRGEKGKMCTRLHKTLVEITLKVFPSFHTVKWNNFSLNLYSWLFLEISNFSPWKQPATSNTHTEYPVMHHSCRIFHHGFLGLVRADSNHHHWISALCLQSSWQWASGLERNAISHLDMQPHPPYYRNVKGFQVNRNSTFNYAKSFLLASITCFRKQGICPVFYLPYMKSKSSGSEKRNTVFGVSPWNHANPPYSWDCVICPIRVTVGWELCISFVSASY